AATDCPPTFLQNTGLPIPKLDIETPIVRLQSNVYREREIAIKLLGSLEFAAKHPLEKALATESATETRGRIHILLDRLSERNAPAELKRHWRSIFILEQIASKEARDILTHLAGGANDARLTNDARIALTPLTKP